MNNPFDMIDDATDGKNPFDGLDDAHEVRAAVKADPNLQAIMSKFARSRLDSIAETARNVPSPEAFTTLDERQRGKAIQDEVTAAEDLHARATRMAQEARSRSDSAAYGAGVEAITAAGQRLAAARKMEEDQRAGIARTASPHERMALETAISAQRKRAEYLQDQIEQAGANASFLPPGRTVADLETDLRREMQTLHKLEAGLDAGLQRPAVADAGFGSEAARGLIRGTFGTVPEMLGGAAKQAGLDGVADVLRHAGRSVRRDTAAESTGQLSEIGDRHGFAKDLKNYVASKLGEGIGTSLPIIAAYMAGGAVAGVGASGSLGIGQMRNALEDAFAEEGVAFPEEHAARYVLIWGTAIGALESVTEIAGMRALTGEAKRQAVRSLARAVASGAAKGAAMEGVTEALQELVEMHGVSQATGKPLDWAEVRHRMTESLAAGAIPGAAMRAVTDAVGNKNAFDVGMAKARELGFGLEPKSAKADAAQPVADAAAQPDAASAEPVKQEVVPASSTPSQPEITTEQQQVAPTDIIDALVPDGLEIDQEAVQAVADAVGVELTPDVAEQVEPKPVENTHVSLDQYLTEGGSLAKSAMPELAKRIGVAEEALPEALDAAVASGTLRKTAGGMYRRAAPAEQTEAAPSEFKQAERQRRALEAIDEALNFGRQILPDGVNIETVPTLRVGRYELDAQSDARTGDIKLAVTALDPKARIGHEGLHTLITRGHVAPDEVAILADAARQGGFWTADAEAQYRTAYDGRDNLDGLIDEEAAALAVEARIKGADFGTETNAIIDRIRKVLERIANALKGRGFKTADDVLDTLLSGDMARRAPVQDWTREEQAVRAAMRRRADEGVPLPDGTAINGVPVNKEADQVLFSLGREKGKPRGVDQATSEGAQPEAIFTGFERTVQRLRDKRNAKTLSLGDVEKLLRDLGVQYRQESSSSISDRFGPSLSTYFYVLTADGEKKIRISDHAYAPVENGIDLRYGSDANVAEKKIRELVGSEVGRDVELIATATIDAERARREELAVVIGKAKGAIFDAERELRRSGLHQFEDDPDALRAIVEAVKTRGRERSVAISRVIAALHKAVDLAKKPEIEREAEQVLFSLGRERQDLDMSLEARKARAEAMGFDTSRVWYHGTPDSRGIWKDGFKTKGEQYGDADPNRVFFFSDHKTARTYADDRRAWDYQNAEAETIPVYLKTGKQKVVDWAGRPYRGRDPEGNGFAVRDEIDKARVEGYDSLLVRRVRDTYHADGKPSEVMVVFDPTNIRSVNAAFDPAQEGSANLLSALRIRKSEPLAGVNSIVRDLAHDLGLTVRQGLKTPAAKKAKRDARRAGSDISHYYDPATGVLRVQSMSDLTAILTHAGEAIIRKFDAFKHPRDIMNPMEQLIGRHAAGLIGSFRGRLFGRISPEFSGIHMAPMTRSVLADYLHAWHASNVATLNRSRDPSGYAKAQRALTNAQRMVARYETKALRQAIDMERANVNSVWGLVNGVVPLDEVRDYVDIRFNKHSQIKTPAPPDVGDAETQRAAFGRWFTTYVTDRDAAEAQDRALFEAFEDLVDRTDPVLSAKLDGATDAIAAYAKANPVQVVQSLISSPKRFGRIAEFFRAVDRDGLVPTLADGMRMLYRGGWDDLHPWYTAVRQLLEIHRINTGHKLDLDAAANAYKLLRIGRHSGAWAGRDLEDGIRARESNMPEGPSLVGALKVALGDDRAAALDMSQEGRYSQFNAYLISRRAVRLWDRYFDGALPNPPANVSREASVAAIQHLEGRFPDFVAAADHVYEFQRQLLRLQRDSGIISGDVFDTLSQEADYVPFMRDMTDKDAAGSRVIRGAKSIIRKIKGSDRNILDPIAMIAQKVYETRQIIATNDAKVALLRLAEAAGPGGGAIAERLDPNTTKAMRVNLKEALRNAAEGEGVSRYDAMALVGLAQEILGDNMVATVFGKGDLNTVGENITWVYENGAPVPIKIADGKLGSLMMETLQTFGNETANIIIEAMAIPASVTRATVTAHPTFIVRNGFVDGILAWMYDAKATPWVTQAMGFVAGLRESGSVVEYGRNAGLMGGPATSALDKLRFDRDVTAMISRGYQPKVWTSPLAFTREIMRHPLRNIALMSEASETGTRARLYELAYQRATANGLNAREAAIEAAFYAHDYMDYSRRGSTVRAFTKLVPFMNAALQGMDRYFRLLEAKGDYGSAWGPYLNYRLGRSQTLELTDREQRELGQSAQAWMVSTLFMGAISLAITVLFWDREDLDDVPQEIKATHWVIPIDGVYHLVPKELPGMREALKDATRGQSVRLPKGFDNAWFANLVERVAGDARKGNPRWFENYTKDLLSIMNPPMEPQAAKLAYEMRTGKDFFSGRDIIPKWKQERFPEMMWDEYTSGFAKWAGKKVDIAPYYIDHAMKQIGTSWARDVLSLNVDGLPWYDPMKPNKTLDDYFIARRFLWKTGKGSESAQIARDIMGAGDPMRGIAGRLFSPYSRLDAASETFKDHIKRRDPASAAELLDSLTPAERGYAILDGSVDGRNSKLKLVHPMHRVDAVLKELSGTQKEVLGNLLETRKRGQGKGEGHLITLSPSEKRAALDILTQIKMMEAHNALVLTGELGYAQRGYFDTGTVWRELEEAVPSVHEELTRRLKRAKIPEFDVVKRAWPGLKTVLESGDLAAAAKRHDQRAVTSKVRAVYTEAK